MCGACENREFRTEDHRTGEGCYKRHIVCAVRHLTLHLSLQDLQDVLSKYLLGIQDLKCQLGDAGYVVFGVVLFVWELLPTSLVVFFFRVRNPTKDLTNPGIVPSRAFNPRSYFFDNPRRYDSDDDLAWSISPHSIHGSFSPDYYDWGHQSNSFMAHVGSLQHDYISETERPSPM
ncbi:hypothetical protein JD844_024881 [Phrynosoma platyrhinos]|uniref:Uncharacterized protein n=1 Tax=Phrynosoma platyrhinos TaxID=52577 RepID=A0ABQ7SYG6_PHRPL|nr:hypothetical protein JD844_024881 [Phrynosoma platyrhinos]